MRRGVTLIELVLVMALIGLVMGVGLGMFASLRPGERAAAGVVQSTLRRASHAALHHAAPAAVRLEPGGNRMHAEVLRVVGTWHFEDPALVRGAFGLDGTLDEGGEIVADGWQGAALSFADAGSGAQVSIHVQSDPAWELDRGFLIELALRREEERAGNVLAIGSSVTLDVGAKGDLAAGFLAEVVDSTGTPRQGEKIRLRTETGVLGVDRWHYLRVGYDRVRMWIMVDGIELATLATDAPVWDVDAPLVLGGGDRTFIGTLDALSVRVVEADSSVELPGEVRFAPDAPPLVSFAPGGGLDAALHSEPVVVALELADGRRATVRVGLFGTVQ